MDPSDFSPLAYGTGLALGVMLILGLPRATAEQRFAVGEDAVGADLSEQPVPVLMHRGQATAPGMARRPRAAVRDLRR